MVSSSLLLNKYHNIFKSLQEHRPVVASLGEFCETIFFFLINWMRFISVVIVFSFTVPAHIRSSNHDFSSPIDLAVFQQES